MGKFDIRWHQRYKNYLKALSQLEKFIKNNELIDHINRVGKVFYKRK